MTTFWTLAAGLILLAIAFVVLPLLRRREYATISADELNLSVFKQQLEELDNDLQAGILDQARYDAARKDLEKELLVDVDGDRVKPAASNSRSGKWLMSVALIIPLMAVGMYQALGNPEIIPRLAENQASSAPHGAASPHVQSGDKMPPMEELVEKLAAKLEKQPDNVEGWLMLGRSYMAMKQPGSAMAAYERGMQVDPENSTLLLAYAEAMAQSSANDFTGKAATLVEKAYQLNKQDPNALWMMGIVAYQKQDYEGAIGYWKEVKGLLGPENKDLNAVDNAIDDARNQLGLEPQLPSIVQTEQQAEPTTAGAADASIELIVKIEPDLAAKVNPEDLVFIYAKALSGPPMPLAAVRKQVKDLPITIRLDDSMAMMPEMRLSAFPEVAVGARISKSGNPVAKSGDLEGEVKPVKPGQAGPVMVIINAIHP
jgi:cytochrome c-type biogenesis protein CcmH